MRILVCFLFFGGGGGGFLTKQQGKDWKGPKGISRKGIGKNTLKTPWKCPETPWNTVLYLKFVTFSTFAGTPFAPFQKEGHLGNVNGVFPVGFWTIESLAFPPTPPKPNYKNPVRNSSSRMGSLAKGSLRIFGGNSAENLRKFAKIQLKGRENSAEVCEIFANFLRIIFCNDPFSNDPISELLRKPF